MANYKTVGNLNYVGSPDYRGYLNYISKNNPSSDIRTYAQALIGSGGSTGYVNNQGQIAQGSLLAPQIARMNSEFYKNYQGLTGGNSQSPGSNPLLAALSAISAANYKPIAPSLDLASLNAKARQQATKAVNPLYSRYLNDFIKEQAFQKKTQETQYGQTVKDLQDALAQTLERNQTSQQRTVEDNANTLGQIGTQADQFQTDTGQQFEQQRQDLGTQAAQSGLGGVGLGAQKVQQATQQQNTAEQRQTEAFSQAKDQANLLKNRSIDDIMRASSEAKTSEGKGEKKAKFDLDTYIKQQSFDLKKQKNTLEQQRQEALSRETSSRTSALVRAFVNSISNPGQKQAALEAYGRYI